MLRLVLALLGVALLVGTTARAADPLQKAREIVAGMKPGEWRELPNTRMQDVFPKEAGHPGWGISGPEAVTEAWGGAAFDTKRNILVVTGGGHGNYGGNEVYQFSLETLRWVRATEPSRMRPIPGKDGQFEVVGDDEAPVSSHTYDGLLYLPNVDRVFKFGGSYYRIGTPYDAHAYLYDVEHRRWKRGAKAPRSGTEVATAYDPKSGEALVRTESGLMTYDPRTDRWREAATDRWESNRVADFDTVDNRLVLIGPTEPPVVYYPFHPLRGQVQPKVAGDLGFLATRSGVAFDPRTARFVIWAGGRDVWTLDPRTWQSVRFGDPNGTAPSATVQATGEPKTRGIYGRWQYVPDLDAFIGYGHSTDNVWLYKLPPVGFKQVAKRETCGGADLCVGPGYRYAVPSEAAAAARPGQTVAIAAGDYVDCAVWRASVTIKGFNGRPHIRDRTCGGKAVWVVEGDDTLIENVELSGGWSSDGNGNAIRLEGRRLVLRNCSIHNNQMGVLTGHNPQAELEIDNCDIYGQRSNAALAHSIYAGKIRRFVARGNYIHGVSSGHNIKSVARENEIVANRLVDETGTEAAMIDVWGCSRSVIEGNAMTKAGVTGNLNFITVAPRVEYGKVIACDDPGRSDVSIGYNTALFTNPEPLWSALFQNSFGARVRAFSNLVVNTRSIEAPIGHADVPPTAGDNLLRRGLAELSELFVDAAHGDLRSARMLPADPPAGAPLPKIEYVYPASSQPRLGTATLGAFEFRER